MRYIAWYAGEKIGVFGALGEAQAAIRSHGSYRKSLFTRRGEPTSRNPNPARFAIYDSDGAGWTL